MARVLPIALAFALSAPTWAFTGKVIDNKGAPVAGASVMISFSWQTEQVFRADAKGEILYSKRPDGNGGFTTTTIKVIDSSGKPVANAALLSPVEGWPLTTLITDKSGQFSFTVPEGSSGIIRAKTSAGTPLAGATLLATTVNPDRKSETRLDEKGEYRYTPQKPVGDRLAPIHVIATGYAYGMGSFLPDSPQTILIKLLPEQIFKSRIVDDDGLPLPDVTVTLYGAGSKGITGFGFSCSPYSTPVTVTTGKDGSFSLQHLPGADSAEQAWVHLGLDVPGRPKITKQYLLDEVRKAGQIALPKK